MKQNGYANPQTINEAINRLPNNSAYWWNVRKRLTKLSKRNPREFWVQYFDAINQPNPDKAASLRELLAANQNPTFADLDKYLAEHNKVSE